MSPKEINFSLSFLYKPPLIMQVTPSPQTKTPRIHSRTQGVFLYLTTNYAGADSGNNPDNRRAFHHSAERELWYRFHMMRKPPGTFGARSVHIRHGYRLSALLYGPHGIPGNGQAH